MFNLVEPIALVCHDAGAANVILAWFTDHASNSQFFPVLEGPALRLWELLDTKLPKPPLVSLEKALEGAGSVLTGTGWASDLEHRARKMARNRGIHSVAVLDHWVNYQDRFVRENVTIFPDEFWVTDDYALREARRVFPEFPITRRPNTYVDRMVAQVRERVVDCEPQRALVVLEPIRSSWGRPGRTAEYQALDFFMAQRQRIGVGMDWQIRLRPHPSESVAKYVPWVEEHGNSEMAFDDSGSLSRALAKASLIVGCESAALVIALLAGKKVVSCLPPEAPACRLPHDGIIHLRLL